MAVVIQKLFRGFKTMKQARLMREEELVFIGMKEPAPKPRELGKNQKTQLTCFTGTKVQILTLQAPLQIP